MSGTQRDDEEAIAPIVLPGPSDDRVPDEAAFAEREEAAEPAGPAPDSGAAAEGGTDVADGSSDPAGPLSGDDTVTLPFVERTPLIAGNWKMNLDHLQAIAHVQKVSWALKDAKHDFAAVEVAVFPPFTDLRSVQTLLSADRLPLSLGAQDVSPEAPGAHTGDIAAAFLAKLETRYVIVGHSERRHGHGEDDALVAAKAKAVAAAGMVPLICVGETAEDLEHSGAAAVPLAQLEAALAALPAGTEYVVAYEPVWAIGSGDPATPEQAQEVCRALRVRIAQLRGEDEAVARRMLYGGSVTSQNVAAYLRQPDIDGALVGGASVNAEEFTRIVRFRHHVTA